MTVRRRSWLVLAMLAIASTSRAAGQAVDSIRPVAEALERFRAGTPPVGALSGGGESREDLVRRLVRGLARRDTARLASLLLNKAEFAWLYYPASRYTRPPFRQSPELLWFRMQETSRKGLGRALARHGGRPLEYRGHQCDPTPERHGNARIWTGCRLTFWDGSSQHQGRFFGAIVELDDGFKFLTFATDY